MVEYIERGNIEKWLLTETASLDGEEGRQYVVERLRNEIPSADVVPVRHGHWIETGEFSDESIDWLRCDRCKAKIPDFEYLYCPKCGAKMDGD